MVQVCAHRERPGRHAQSATWSEILGVSHKRGIHANARAGRAALVSAERLFVGHHTLWMKGLHTSSCVVHHASVHAHGMSKRLPGLHRESRFVMVLPSRLTTAI